MNKTYFTILFEHAQDAVDSSFSLEYCDDLYDKLCVDLTLSMNNIKVNIMNKLLEKKS